MKATLSGYKFYFLAFFLFAVAVISRPTRVYGQIDYYYGRNNRGVRISAGVGAATLVTHFNHNPPQLTYLGSLDYDFSPFLSFGFEGQYGKLRGEDDVHHLRYYSSTNKYISATANFRVAFGQFFNFERRNDLHDIIERLYLGVGAGVIHNKITFEDHPDGSSSTIYGDPHPYGNYLLIPMNLGTNIDLPGVLGIDRVSINPNFQLNYVNSLYLDGFQSSQYSSLKGFYNVVSVKLKYKF